MKLDHAHLVHYAIIVCIVLTGVGLTALFSADKNMQLLVMIITAISYVIYGLLHHKLEHDVTIKIVLEYILVAGIAIALFIFVRGGM